MNSEFTVTSEQKQASVPVTVLHIGGWLDAQSEEQLIEAAREAHEAGARYLLMEMSSLDTLTSAGMRALQKVYQLYLVKDESPRQIHLKLCSASPQIHSVLEITGFLQNIPMYESMEEALSSFGKD